MRLKLSFLAIKENTKAGANPTPHHPEKTIPMVVAASCYWDVYPQQGQGNWSELKGWMVLNTGKFLRETCFSLPEIWGWDGGSPSSRTLSILLNQHLSGLSGNIYMSWNGLIKAQTSIPIENLWYDLKIAVHQRNPSNLKELEQFCLEEWANIPVARCAKHIETCSCNCCQRRLYKVLFVSQ